MRGMLIWNLLVGLFSVAVYFAEGQEFNSATAPAFSPPVCWIGDEKGPRQIECPANPVYLGPAFNSSYGIDCSQAARRLSMTGNCIEYYRGSGEPPSGGTVGDGTLKCPTCKMETLPKLAAPTPFWPELKEPLVMKDCALVFDMDAEYRGFYRVKIGCAEPAPAPVFRGGTKEKPRPKAEPEVILPYLK